MDKTPTVMVGAPVRDRAWILPTYLEHIYNLNYDKKKIILCFVINDSRDASESIINKWLAEYGEEYSSTIVVHCNQGQIPDERTHYVREKIYHTLSIVRNKFLDTALRSRADYLFSVDSDILVQPETLNELLKSDKDIVAAQIWNDASKRYPNILMKNKAGTIRHYFDFPKNSLFKCDVTGAVYLISRRVLEAGVRYGYHRQGEDITFCEDAKAKRFTIWANTSVCCDHIMNLAQLATFKKPG